MPACMQAFFFDLLPQPERWLLPCPQELSEPTEQLPPPDE